MQQLNPAEISDIIRGRIDNLDVSAQAANEGTIVSVSDGIVRVHGLAEAQYGEMIEFTGGLFGMALNLERDSVGCVVLGEYEKLSEGMTARCTKRILEFPPAPNFSAGSWTGSVIPSTARGRSTPPRVRPSRRSPRALSPDKP